MERSQETRIEFKFYTNFTWRGTLGMRNMQFKAKVKCVTDRKISYEARNGLEENATIAYLLTFFHSLFILLILI